MLRVWNVTLVIITFLLTIFGTFMTRSGVVQSVHAFGEDPGLARMFIVFMVTSPTFSFGWVIYRLPMLQARNELDSWVSREAAFLANNWILLFSAFFVLFATMFPTITEAITGERLTVGPPFFNKWMTPIGLVLLLLTGVGPLLAWRKSTLANLPRAVPVGPVALALVVGGVRGGARRARLELGHLLRAVRLRLRHDRAGILARRATCGRATTGTDSADRDGRPGRPQQAPLRRLHRPPRHRADVPRLRRRGVQPGRAAAAEAGRGGHGRRLHAASRRPARDRRWPEADGHRRTSR